MPNRTLSFGSRENWSFASMGAVSSVSMLATRHKMSAGEAHDPDGRVGNDCLPKRRFMNSKGVKMVIGNENDQVS